MCNKKEFVLLFRTKKRCGYWFLEVDFNGFALVGDEVADGLIRHDGLGVVFGDQDDVELPLLEHSWERALAFADGHGVVGVVVVDVDGAVGTLFVVVVGTFIFVEFEMAVTSCVDVEVDEVGRFFVTPFHVGAYGEDGAFGDEDGDGGEGGG